MNYEFKGNKENWQRVVLEQTEFYNRRNEIHYGKDGECVAEFVANDYDAQLISCAPEMFEETKETITDLKILRNQILDASKTNHLFEGMPELMDKWIERKEQLLKKATTI